MNKNIQRVFLLTTLLVLLAGIGALSAADVNDNTTATTIQDTPTASTQSATTVTDTTSNKVVEDTQIATTTSTKNAVKETQTTTKKQKTVKTENEPITVDNDNFDDTFSNEGLINVEDNDKIIIESNITKNNKTYVINQPVTIDGNGYTISLNTTSGSYYGNETGASFIIDNGAAGSILRNINFYNTQVIVRNTTNVTIDNCTFTVYNQRIGQGIGATSIRDGSSYITVENSNFSTTNNDGSSTLVLAGADHCIINNNNITGTGDVGNLLYLTTYNIEGVNETDIELNSYNNITNNIINGPSSVTMICFGIALTGHDNLIANNEINYSGQAITTQWGYIDPAEPQNGNNSDRYKGNNYINNTITGGTFKATNNSTLENNTSNGAVTSGSNSTLKNNNFTGSVTLEPRANATNNLFGTTTLNGNNDLENNTVNGNVNVGKNNVLKSNTINGNIIINNQNNIIESNFIDGNITIKSFNLLINNNNITGNITVTRKTYTNITITNNIIGGKLINNLKNTNIIDENNTYSVSFNNIKSVSSKSIKSARTRVYVNDRNINNYFITYDDISYDFDLSKLSENTDIIIAVSSKYKLGMLYIPNNSTLTILSGDTTEMCVTINENSTFMNSTFTFNPSHATVNINTGENNAVIDGLNIIANPVVEEGEINAIDVLNDNFVMKNSKLTVNMLANTIDWGQTTRPNIVPISIGANNALIENNTIIINVTGYVENNGFDYPTCYGFYISGDNTTLRNNNISIICADNIPGWLYSFEVLSSNNVFDNNNITVRGINYTAGVYFDSSNSQNNTVSNNYINLTTGNAGYGEGTINENVGYAITFTNRAYMGGQYKGAGSFKNNTAVNNTIVGNGYAIYGIEQFGGDNTTVVNNTIILNGTAVSGVAMIGINTTVTGNNITVNGRDNGTYPTVDYLTEQTTGVSFQRGSNNIAANNTINCQNNAGIIIKSDNNSTITRNTVNSLNNTYAVTIDDNSNNISVIQNRLTANERKDDSAVLNQGKNSTIKNTKLSTTLNVGTSEILPIYVVDDNVIINGTLADSEGNNLDNVNVILTIDDETPVTVTVNNGKFTYTYIAKNAKEGVTVTANFTGNDDYLTSYDTAQFDVEQLGAILDSVTVDNTIINGTTSVTGKLIEESTSKAIANAVITITVNGNTYNVTTFTDGSFSINIRAPGSVGTYNVVLNYAGNNKYVESSVTKTFDVEKRGTTLTINPIANIKVGNNISVSGRLVDETNAALNGTVRISINNQRVNANVTNGVFNANIPVNSVGTYNVTVNYEGDDNYYSSNNVSTVTVEIRSTTLTLEPVSQVKSGDSITVNGRLVDETGTAVASAQITITVEGETYHHITNNNGSFTRSFTVNNVGTSDVVVNYDGNSRYTGSNATTSYTVTKLGTTLKILNTTSANNNNLTITGTLTDEKNKQVSNATVIITIENQNYTTITNNNGEFTTTIQIKQGLNSIQVTYSGNNTLEQTTTNFTYNKLKYNTTITLNNINTTHYGNNININGLLADSGNTGINNATLNIKINDKNYNTIANNGLFNITVKADTIGINNVTVTYNGSAIYNNSTASAVFNVTKVNTVITTTSMTGYLGSNVALNATIKDANGNTITSGQVLIKLNNKSNGYANITRDGQITYNLYLDPNSYGKEGYNITFVYGGTDTTESARTDTRLNVIPFNPVINLTVSPTDIGDTVVMTVKVTNGHGYNALSGNIRFKINGLTYKVNKEPVKEQVNNGTAVLRFYASKKFIGNNNITILYSGNGKFDQIKQDYTNILYINNYKQTVITTQPAIAKIGQNVVITAKFTDKNGNPLTKGAIAIKINGKTFGHANITNGTATYTQYIDPNKFSAKNYTITIKFGGKGQYAPAQVNTTLSLSKYTPTFTYTPTTVNNRTTARITLKIADGQVNANNGTVGLKINGKTYKINKKPVTVKPNNGVATFNIPTNNLQANNNLTFTYGGDRQFNGGKIDIVNGLRIRT